VRFSSLESVDPMDERKGQQHPLFKPLGEGFVRDKTEIERTRGQMKYAVMKRRLGTQVYEDAEDEDNRKARDVDSCNWMEHLNHADRVGGSEHEASRGASMFKPLQNCERCDCERNGKGPLQYSLMKLKLGAHVYDDAEDDDNDGDRNGDESGDMNSSERASDGNVIQSMERDTLHCSSTTPTQPNDVALKSSKNADGAKSKDGVARAKKDSAKIRRSPKLGAQATLGYSASSVQDKRCSFEEWRSDRRRAVSYGSPYSRSDSRGREAFSRISSGLSRSTRIKSSIADVVLGGLSRARSRRRAGGGERFY